MKYLFFVAGLLIAATQTFAATRLIASFEDPSGDDTGAGNLAYPLSADYQEGDLDLRTVKVSSDDEGFWFDATFANSIRNPSSAYMGAAADSIADVARKGFYTFNIDVYVDVDRKRDSGNTFSLPGRSVRIDSAYAWEKAVILTPRPELMRAELLDALQRQYPQRSPSEAEASIDQAIYFSTKIKVRGRTISYFVPKNFFGSTEGLDWAITVLVTGAKPYISAGGGLMPSRKTPLEEIELGVLQPSPGRPRATFGFSGGGNVSPVVDALLVSPGHQHALLSNQAPLTGVSWGIHSVNDSAGFSAPSTALAPVANGAVPNGTTNFLRRLMGESTQEKMASGTASPIKSYLDPELTGTGSSATIDRTIQASVSARLNTLKKLLNDGLIDEVEYKQQKQRILGDL
jgi:hypothetical protein